MKNPARRNPSRRKSAPPQHRPAEAAGQTAHRNVWATAMIDVALETTANLANLPPAEREHARLWATVLASVAQDLLSGDASPSTLFDLPRPWT
jgi:hypothetical protein